MAPRHHVSVLPRALKSCRRQEGITQHLLAERARCSESLISLIEIGRRQPSYDTAVRIADALGVDVEDFAQVRLAEESAA